MDRPASELNLDQLNAIMSDPFEFKKLAEAGEAPKPQPEQEGPFTKNKPDDTPPPEPVPVPSPQPEEPQPPVELKPDDLERDLLNARVPV